MLSHVPTFIPFTHVHVTSIFISRLNLLRDEYTLRVLQRLKLMHFMNMYITGCHVSQEKKYMTKSYHITFSFHIFLDLDYVPFENKCIVLLQTVLEWSHEKYAAVFNSYSDNIAGRSFRSR